MTYPLELHPVPDEGAEALADAAGLPLALASDSCEHCESRIGRSRGGFGPYVVVLDQDDRHWLVCASCAQPTLAPGDPE